MSDERRSDTARRRQPTGWWLTSVLSRERRGAERRTGPSPGFCECGKDERIEIFPGFCAHCGRPCARCVDCSRSIPPVESWRVLGVTGTLCSTCGPDRCAIRLALGYPPKPPGYLL